MLQGRPGQRQEGVGVRNGLKRQNTRGTPRSWRRLCTARGLYIAYLVAGVQMLAAAVLQEDPSHPQDLNRVVHWEGRILRAVCCIAELQVLPWLDVLIKELVKAIEQGNPLRKVALRPGDTNTARASCLDHQLCATGRVCEASYLIVRPREAPQRSSDAAEGHGRHAVDEGLDGGRLQVRDHPNSSKPPHPCQKGSLNLAVLALQLTTSTGFFSWTRIARECPWVYL